MAADDLINGRRIFSSNDAGLALLEYPNLNVMKLVFSNINHEHFRRSVVDEKYAFVRRMY